MNRISIQKWLFGCLVGFGLGWGSSVVYLNSLPVHALAADSADHSQLVSCIVTMEYNDARKVQIPVEGLVYLDYRRGKLVVTMPELRQFGQQKRILSNFSERDLVEDFEIKPGTTPKFLMSSFSTGALSDSGQILAVIESQSRQTRLYKLTFQQSGVEFKPQFNLVESKVFDMSGNTEVPKAIQNNINPSLVKPQIQ